MAIESLQQMKDQLAKRLELTSRTFNVSQHNAGILGLGARIEVLNEGKTVDEKVVYGFTLEAIRKHTDAQADGNIERIIETNKKLPKRFQYFEDASL